MSVRERTRGEVVGEPEGLAGRDEAVVGAVHRENGDVRSIPGARAGRALELAGVAVDVGEETRRAACMSPLKRASSFLRLASEEAGGSDAGLILLLVEP